MFQPLISIFCVTQVWDLRKTEYPLFQLCENTDGILGLSWSPFDNDVLVGCTNNEMVVTLNVKRGEVRTSTIYF
jgi:hypothetical protein